VYVVRSSDEVDEQIAQLPADAAARFAELRVALELNPWAGDPYVRDNPRGAMRSWAFESGSGDGLVSYLILERDLVVDLLSVIWFG
jgi:hypothetical protein